MGDWRKALVLSLFLLGFISNGFAQKLERKPWTTSRISGSPDPPKPYIGEVAFKGLEFKRGLEIIPYQGWLIVIERHGKIWALDEKLSKPTLHLVADFSLHEPKLSAVYGIAFHPNSSKGEVYITYVIQGKHDDGSRLSRFKLKLPKNNPPTIDLSTDCLLYTSPSPRD